MERRVLFFLTGRSVAPARGTATKPNARRLRALQPTVFRLYAGRDRTCGLWVRNPTLLSPELQRICAYFERPSPSGREGRDSNPRKRFEPLQPLSRRPIRPLWHFQMLGSPSGGGGLAEGGFEPPGAFAQLFKTAALTTRPLSESQAGQVKTRFSPFDSFCSITSCRLPVPREATSPEPHVRALSSL